MKTYKLNKDINRSISKSLGRFISIFVLMVLGVFAFVGLKVSGPNMRMTAERFYNTHHLAHLTVTSTVGLDKSDQEIIQSALGISNVEFGYFQDVLIKDTKTSVRLFSPPQNVSTYELKNGKLPENTNEIALDFLKEDTYKIGDQITFEKNGEILKNHSFTITGFVKSSEFVDKNSLGATTIGTGQLNSYAVVSKEVFHSDVYMIARILYTDLKNVSLFDDTFAKRTAKHEEQMKQLLLNQPQKRLASLKAEPQKVINDGQAKMKDGLQTLKDKQAQIDNGKAQLAAFGLPVSQELQDAQKQIDAARLELEKKQQELNDHQEQLNNLSVPEYFVNDRNAANPGYQSFLDDSTRIDTLANVFPVFLFLIAALVSLTTMTRFVEEERKNIGLLKALGYTNHQIQKKFIIYGLVSACSGALVGSILGHTFLPIAVFTAYTASSTFSNLVLTFSPFWTLVAFGIAILCTVVPAFLVSRSDLKDAPASLFLAKVPKQGSRIFLERITPIWNRLSFTYKVTARNLFRYKKRMLMTIFGIAGCTGLLVMGFGIRDSLAGISDRQFGDILHYDMIAVSKDNPTTDQLKSLDTFLTSEVIHDSEAIHFEQLSLRAGSSNSNQEISLFVPKVESEFSRFITLRTRIGHEKLTLANDGMIISEKLAKITNTKLGDTLTFTDGDDQTRRVKIIGICEVYMGHY
ncbi:MAG: FtsX-like permease family protein, partial [Streptococcaceae bacterium]|nr:FtsX-like permease family protein [Streptococcaceae bacterium]